MHLCRQLLALDYTVISVARRLPEWQHPKLNGFQADLLDAAETRAVAAKIANKFDVTHFIHNAGMILPNLIKKAAVDDLQQLAQLHAGAALTFVQAFLPAMKKHHFGRILFNSSRAALGRKHVPPIPIPRQACTAWRALGRWNWGHRETR